MTLQAASKPEFFTLSPVAHLILDASGRILDANPAAFRLLGRKRHPLGSLAGFLAPASRPLLEKALGSISRAGEGQVFLALRLRRGASCRIHFQGTRLNEPQDCCLCAISEAGQDTVDCHSNGQSAPSVGQESSIPEDPALASGDPYHIILEKLRATQAVFQTALDQSPAGIVIADAPDGRLRYLNPAGFEIIGHPSNPDLSSIQGREYATQWQILDRYGAPFPNDELPLNLAIRSGIPCSSEFVIRRREDGEKRIIYVNAGPVRDHQGRTSAGVAVFIDITDRIVAEEKLKEVNEALEHRVAERTAELSKANQAKSDFLARMSHEIRTPMNAILGLAELLMDSPLTHEQQEYLRGIILSGKTLLALINDILDLSKIESGKIHSELVEFNLPLLLEELQSTQTAGIAGKPLRFVLDLPQSLPRFLLGDQLRLKQILLNLVSNAVKFTSQGEIRLTVRAVEPAISTPQRHLFEFTVSDTGIGISAETMSQLFTPFFQARLPGGFPQSGTGLGLAISRRLAEAMEGTLTASSEPGRGSSFTLRLPFTVRPHRLGQEPAPTFHKPLADTWEHPPLRILVAEDHPLNRLMLVKLLESMGHTVVAAANGNEAVARTLEFEFDLLLLDIQMPELDGIGATKAIRQREASHGRSVPIIALTAFAFEEDRKRLLASGFDGYIGKPLQIEQLIAEMKNSLDKRSCRG